MCERDYEKLPKNTLPFTNQQFDERMVSVRSEGGRASCHATLFNYYRGTCHIVFTIRHLDAPRGLISTSRRREMRMMGCLLVGEWALVRYWYCAWAGLHRSRWTVASVITLRPLHLPRTNVNTGVWLLFTYTPESRWFQSPSRLVDALFVKDHGNLTSAPKFTLVDYNQCNLNKYLQCTTTM